MFRLLSLLPALALSAATTAAPIPEGAARPVFYHPTRVDDRWVYTLTYHKLDTANQNRLVQVQEDRTWVVTAARVTGREAVVRTAIVADGRETPMQTLRVSAEGVFILKGPDGKEVSPPNPLLKTPVRVGDAWEREGNSVVGAIRTRREVRGVEWVEVPAGKYQAVRVDTRLRAGGEDYRLTDWYAEGVGLVQSASDGLVSTVLKSFTPGRP